jgi:hypothetical protein
MTTLNNLKELWLEDNGLLQPPISVLMHLTALKFIRLCHQRPKRGQDDLIFTIATSLLPILHPGLEGLDLRHDRFTNRPFNWDKTSLSHLQHAMAEAATMTPIPTLKF